MKIIKNIKFFLFYFFHDSLYRNSLYLILTTFLGSVVGFIYWFINTKIFTPDQIGIATTLISSVSLLSSFSLLGLNVGIVRYLPKSENKNLFINTVIISIFIISLLISIFYIFYILPSSHHISNLYHNYYFIFIYIFIVIVYSLEAIYTNVFLSFRENKYIFYKSIVINIFKIISPILMLSIGFFAIFISSTFGMFLGFCMSLFLLKKYHKYTFKIQFDKKILLSISKLSIGNYIAAFTASLPLNILPLLITNNLGPKSAAFFYLDLTIVNLLNSIHASINQSLFAAGSHSEENLKDNIYKTIKFNILLLLPTIFVILFFGKYILLVFGKQYSSEGFILLQLLSLSVIFTSINGIISSILNIKKKVNMILLMCVLGTIIMLTGFYFSIPHGLVAIGYSWLFSEGIIAMLYIIFSYKYVKKNV